MTSYISAENDFGLKEIRPITSQDLKKFSRSKFSQPLPSDSEGVILTWISKLVEESYNYSRANHIKWHNNALDYYQAPSLDDKQRVGRNTAVDPDQDTEVMVPALIKRYVDLGANWLTREIFKSKPFMQFTSYESDPELLKAQKLYERKIQGDTETFGARERSTELGIDLFLYGNSVAKVNYNQDRLLTMEIPEIELEVSEDAYNVEDFDMDEEAPESEVTIKMEDPEPIFSIIDQYSEFKPIYLGHYIIDPIPPGRDWKKAAYMGDFEFVSAEEIMERYGLIKGFANKFINHSKESNGRLNIVPFTGGSNPFLDDWCRLGVRGSEDLKSRKIHSVLHLYTKYTETCIIDDNIVVYHKYRSKNVSKAGAFPYVMFKLPSPTGGLFSIGYGHILRTLQLEQIILASKRLQGIEDINNTYTEYVAGQVDPDKIKNIKGMNFLEVENPGAVREVAPNQGAVDLFLNAESRNFERAREYAGIPGLLDSSNTKTHLGAVSQRMEASQVQFDVILETVRDGFKEIFQKIHVYNMAFLEGSVPIKGGTGPFDKDFNDNVLSEEELMLLANQSDLSIQLNLGMDVGAEKLKNFAALINTQPIAQNLQMLIESGALGADKLMELTGRLFTLGGLSEFSHIFEPSPETMMQQQQQQAPIQQGPPQEQPIPQEGNLPPGMQMSQ